MADNRYFMVPVIILQDAHSDIKKVANNIIDLGVYLQSLNLQGQDDLTKMRSSAEFFGLTFHNLTGSLADAKRVHFRTKDKGAVVSLKTDIVMDYYNNTKTEYEISLFCAYAAFKSIIGNKPYIKMTNDFFLARFFGFNAIADMSSQFKSRKVYTKYSSRYAMDKVKEGLKLDWGLQLYGRNTRGFYASFKLDYETLIYEAEKNRKAYKAKEMKRDQAEALKRAMMRLEAETA